MEPTLQLSSYKIKEILDIEHYKIKIDNIYLLKHFTKESFYKLKKENLKLTHNQLNNLYNLNLTGAKLAKKYFDLPRIEAHFYGHAGFISRKLYTKSKNNDIYYKKSTKTYQKALSLDSNNIEYQIIILNEEIKLNHMFIKNKYDPDFKELILKIALFPVLFIKFYIIKSHKPLNFW